MEKIDLRQEKPLKIKILAGLMLFSMSLQLLRLEKPWFQISFLLASSMLLLGYSISYRITRDFENRKFVKVFGFTIWKSNLSIDFPEYISVFSTSFKQSNEWGTVSALGTKSRNDAVVIRFFKENRNFTVYQSNSYIEARDKANELGALLNVDIYEPSNQ